MYDFVVNEMRNMGQNYYTNVNKLLISIPT